MIIRLFLLLVIFTINSYAQPSLNGYPNNCDTSGMADSYVLALSSQSGFCETYGYEQGKPECMKLSKDSYQANHFTLHGLWPNQDACGYHYGFCGVEPRVNHCDYPAISFNTAVSSNLKKLMPSYYYGSCLERHEWNKHGSCQMLTPDDYFTLAMRLTTEMDNSAFGQYITEHRGKTVPLMDLRDLIKSEFGSNNAGKIYLGCKNGVLVDVFIQLPALIVFDEPLVSLIEKAPNSKNRDYCPKKIKISNFNRAVGATLI